MGAATIRYLTKLQDFIRLASLRPARAGCGDVLVALPRQLHGRWGRGDLPGTGRPAPTQSGKGSAYPGSLPVGQSLCLDELITEEFQLNAEGAKREA